MTWLRHKEVEHNSLTELASWALKGPTQIPIIGFIFTG